MVLRWKADNLLHQYLRPPIYHHQLTPTLKMNHSHNALAVVILAIFTAEMATAQYPSAAVISPSSTGTSIVSKPLNVVEKDPRAQSNGPGWRLDQAVITDASLPRVLLIGDSILNGYLQTVIRKLSGKAYVDAWVNPLCQSEEFNKKLGEVLDKGPYDVVHINLGLHGWQKDRTVPGVAEKQPRIPPGQFEPLTKAFVEVMRSKCPKARIIWASTTPITVKGNPTELDPEYNTVIVEHNRMAAKVMNEMSVPVNDFYGMLVNRLDLKANELHWKGPAYTIIGNACADSVMAALPQSSHSK